MVTERGQWWRLVDDTEVDIDVVAKIADGNQMIHTVLGECKFSRKPVGFGIYNTLVSRAKSAKFTENVSLILFSALGFEEDLSDYAEENGITLVDGQILIGDKTPPILFKS